MVVNNIVTNLQDIARLPDYFYNRFKGELTERVFLEDAIGSKFEILLSKSTTYGYIYRLYKLFIHYGQPLGLWVHLHYEGNNRFIMAVRDIDMNDIVYPPTVEHLLPRGPLTLIETLNAAGTGSSLYFPGNYSPPRAADGPPPTQVPENGSPSGVAAIPPPGYVPENGSPSGVAAIPPPGYVPENDYPPPVNVPENDPPTLAAAAPPSVNVPEIDPHPPQDVAAPDAVHPQAVRYNRVSCDVWLSETQATLNNMNLPTAFVRRGLLRNDTFPSKVIITDQNERLYYCRIRWSYSSNRPHAYIVGKWRQFCSDNNLRRGSLVRLEVDPDMPASIYATVMQ
ncbi:hypothetical protein L195_g045643, partial [Trifolium pratense]